MGGEAKSNLKYCAPQMFVPGEARLSVPAAVDQNGNVSSSFFFFLLRLEAFWHTISADYGHSTKLESSFDVLSSL